MDDTLSINLDQFWNLFPTLSDDINRFVQDQLRASDSAVASIVTLGERIVKRANAETPSRTERPLKRRTFIYGTSPPSAA